MEPAIDYRGYRIIDNKFVNYILKDHMANSCRGVPER